MVFWLCRAIEHGVTMAANPLGIEVVFFDIDGTLFSHTQGCIPESARDALAQLRAGGVKTVIATGRHKVDLKTLPTADLNFDGYIALNGQMILDESLRLIAGTPINAAEAEILTMAFKAKKIPFLILTENQRYMNFIDALTQEALDKGEFTLPEPSAYDAEGDAIFQLCAFVGDEDRELLDSILDECNITSWSPIGIDIVPKGGGKSVGIEKFLEAEGIDRSRTMAFGDGENDLDMLEYVQVGVAMGNGGEDVKKVADYVTSGIDDDGVADALRHFGLID